MLHLTNTRFRLAVIATIVAVALGVTGGLSLFPPRTVDAAVASQPRLEAAERASQTIAAPDAAALVVDVTLKQATPIADPEPAASMRTARSSTTARTTSTTTAAKPAGSELSQARSILASLIAQHPILKGTTVSFGDARGYQAIALYTSGRIIISPSHTASLSRILNHEVWHIIDWRDNGTIDWGENVPPR